MPASAPASAPTAAAVRDLWWLSGTWAGPVGGGTFTAHYTIPGETTLLSFSELVKDGEVVFHELERFVVSGKVVRLLPYPGGKPAVYLNAVEIDPGNARAVFENPEKDFPTRIVYHRVAHDRLIITASDPHGGSDRVDTFDLRAELPPDRTETGVPR